MDLRFSLQEHVVYVSKTRIEDTELIFLPFECAIQPCSMKLEVTWFLLSNMPCHEIDAVSNHGPEVTDFPRVPWLSQTNFTSHHSQA